MHCLHTLLARLAMFHMTAQGHAIASASHDADTTNTAFGLQIWSVHTAMLLTSCRGHDGEVTDLAVNLDSTIVASSSNDTTIRCWSLEVHNLCLYCQRQLLWNCKTTHSLQCPLMQSMKDTVLQLPMLFKCMQCQSSHESRAASSICHICST